MSEKVSEKCGGQMVLSIEGAGLKASSMASVSCSFPMEIEKQVCLNKTYTRTALRV